MTRSLDHVPEETRERQRLVYHDLTLTMGQVTERLGLSQSAVYERAQAWGWPGRRRVGLGAGEACPVASDGSRPRTRRRGTRSRARDRPAREPPAEDR